MKKESLINERNLKLS